MPRCSPSNPPRPPPGPASAPAKPEAKARPTIRVPADFRVGEAAEYSVQLKLTKVKEGKKTTSEIKFPAKVRVLETEGGAGAGGGALLEWAFEAPAAANLSEDLLERHGTEIVLLRGFAPKVRIKEEDASAQLVNLAEAKSRVEPTIAEVVEAHKKHGLEERDVPTMTKVLRSALGTDELVEGEAVRLAKIWYTPTYMEGPLGPGEETELEFPLSEQTMVKAKRRITFEKLPGASAGGGGAKIIINAQADRGVLGAFVVEQVEKSGIKLSPAQKEKLRGDTSSEMRFLSEYTTDAKGWLIRSRNVEAQVLAGNGTSVEFLVERKGAVKAAKE